MQGFTEDGARGDVAVWRSKAMAWSSNGGGANREVIRLATKSTESASGERKSAVGAIGAEPAAKSAVERVVVGEGISKGDLKEELVRLLAADLESRERAYRAAREAATHEEAKPENDKDTRALEQSYLARGEAGRVEELRASLAEVRAMGVKAFREGERATLGALVTVDEDGVESVYWLAPRGGGTRLAKGRVQVVTPSSPLGRALVGTREGDDCSVALAGKTRELAIVRVR
jgi:transcription elongation GreA/GreB family factor